MEVGAFNKDSARYNTFSLPYVWSLKSSSSPENRKGSKAGSLNSCPS